MFLKRFFKEKEHQSTFDDIRVFLETDKKLSDEQKQTIIAIVKRGIASGKTETEISSKVLLQTGIFDTLVIRKLDEGFYRVVY